MAGCACVKHTVEALAAVRVKDDAQGPVSNRFLILWDRHAAHLVLRLTLGVQNGCGSVHLNNSKHVAIQLGLYLLHRILIIIRLEVHKPMAARRRFSWPHTRTPLNSQLNFIQASEFFRLWHLNFLKTLFLRECLWSANNIYAGVVGHRWWGSMLSSNRHDIVNNDPWVIPAGKNSVHVLSANIRHIYKRSARIFLR